MGRITNFVYGALIAFVALDAMFLHILPESLTPFAVILLGVLVLLTPIASIKRLQGQYVLSPRAPFQLIRRWIFGLFLVFMGIVSFVGSLESSFPYVAVSSASGQLILLGIGVIYFFAAFARMRNVEMSTI